jgi:hypothetical protein
LCQDKKDPLISFGAVDNNDDQHRQKAATAFERYVEDFPSVLKAFAKTERCRSTRKEWKERPEHTQSFSRVFSMSISHSIRN